ncbi:MAG: alpha-mannosidase, partial [Clostridia bacterium]|nr:alpha-mannosidase [Clostridia bacterium]
MQTHQLSSRLQKLVSVMREQTVLHTCAVDAVTCSPAGEGAWAPFVNGSEWGAAQEWMDFRFTCTVPETFTGRTYLRLRTGLEAEWEAINPQFLASVDGRIEQAFDTKHTALLLSETPEPGRTFDVLLNGYAPSLRRPGQRPPRLEITLTDEDAELIGLIYDIEVPLEAACLLPDGDAERERTLYTLAEAADLLDLRYPNSEEWAQGIKAARAYLRENFYEKRASLPPIAVGDSIGHTHIDVAWLWDIYQTRHKAARSFATVLKLMEQYPEYKFMSSQPALYSFVKEDHPDLYERIREKVKEGRWQPEGGMWLEADCNLTSGESLVRQFLHGQEFFRKEFGVRNHVLWLPDVFGYSAALPQICKLSGIDYFFTSKLSWSEFNLYPYDTFLWRGIDGTEMLTHFTPTRDARESDRHEGLQFYTTYNAMVQPSQYQGGWKRFQQKALDDHFLVSYGYGDGGGGPTDWMLENARRMAAPMPGTPVFRHTMPYEFFKDLEKRVSGSDRLPKWSGELYLEYHRGTYTSIAKNKRNNRKTELALRDLELLSSAAYIEKGLPYPADEIHKMWEDTLTLQFHDILPGSSIEKVYEDSDKTYARIRRDCTMLTHKAMDALAEDLGGDIVFFNTLDFERDDVVWFDAPASAAGLMDGEGNVYPIQRSLTLDGDAEKACAYVCGLKPMGATAFRFVSECDADEYTDADTSGFDTPFFRGTFDGSMRIVSLIEKVSGRELVREGQVLNRLVSYENRPHNYDNWDINIYYDRRHWDVDHLTDARVISDGPVMTVIRCIYSYKKSTIVQDIRIYRDIERIDFDTRIDWQEDHQLLKAHFPVDIFQNKATYDVQFGNVERPTHRNTSWDVAKFEVCAHKWADVSEDA